MGLLARYTDAIDLPAGWQWLSNGWVLVILAVLLAIEVVADKVPVVDHVNDVVQTVVRPTAGGSRSAPARRRRPSTVTDPGSFFGSHQWVPIAAGVVIALCRARGEGGARPVVNATTAGVGAPVASTAEDIGSAVMSLLAILLPILVLVGLVLDRRAVWVFRRAAADANAAG
jgi:hypothetical protein